VVKNSNITIMQTHFPKSRFHDAAWVDSERRRMLQEALAGPLKGQFDNPVQWFYDPMAVTAFAGKMNERATVYDCMDELSQFKGAPPELIARERQLLGRGRRGFRRWPQDARIEEPLQLQLPLLWLRRRCGALRQARLKNTHSR
jgi:hypothetical protein